MTIEIEKKVITEINTLSTSIGEKSNYDSRHVRITVFFSEVNDAIFSCDLKTTNILMQSLFFSFQPIEETKEILN